MWNIWSNQQEWSRPKQDLKIIKKNYGLHFYNDFHFYKRRMLITTTILDVVQSLFVILSLKLQFGNQLLPLYSNSCLLFRIVCFLATVLPYIVKSPWLRVLLTDNVIPVTDCWPEPEPYLTSWLWSRTLWAELTSFMTLPQVTACGPLNKKREKTANSKQVS